MDASERELFATAVAAAVARAGDDPLDGALTELGWTDALAADPQTAVSVLFEAQGRAAATSSALDALLAVTLGAEPVGAVVLPAFGATDPPGAVHSGSLEVDGLATAALDGDGPVLVPCTRKDGVALATVAPAALTLRPVAGLDPALGLRAVTATLVQPEDISADQVPWEVAVAAGQRALAHELVGASAAMLDLAREHALERIQFGVPIASFQAVRHKLAEVLVAIESARAALDVAWTEPGGGLLPASMAKAIAGRSARVTARHCQQVLAGIGFTLEHPFHRSLRRVRVLDGLLGDSRSVTRTLGDQLLRDRSLPDILPL